MMIDQLQAGLAFLECDCGEGGALVRENQTEKYPREATKLGNKCMPIPYFN